MTYLESKAEPFYLKGKKDRVLLFIHGITASPSEVYPTADLVHIKTGCSVKGILLPGHGTSLKDLSMSRWTDWYKAVKNEIEELQLEYGQVFVAGLSMGGLLSLYAGIKNKSLAGIISINAPIFLKIPAVDIIAPIARLVVKNIPKSNSSWNKELNSKGRFNYNATPVDAFQSMWQLRHKVAEGLGDLTMPLLVMQSLLDETVRSDSGSFIAARAVNSSVELIELKFSRHVATMDVEKEAIARKITDFMQQRQNV